jgi:hypothetical protein
MPIVKKLIIYWLLVLLIVSLLLWAASARVYILSDGTADFVLHIKGTESRPFVFRMLLPMAVRAVTPWIPSALTSPFESNEFIQKVLANFGAEDYLTQTLLIILGLFGSLLGYVYYFRKFAFLFDYSTASVNMLSVFSLPGLLMLTGPFKIYDYPALFLSTITMYMMVREKWVSYLFFFLLSSINKETTVLFSVLYAVYYWRKLSPAKYIGLLLFQVVAASGTRFLIQNYYRNNPGESFQSNIPEFINALVEVPIAVLLVTLIGLMVCLLMASGWNTKPPFLRTAMITVGLPLLILHFIMGYPFETRVFMEIYPLLLLLMLDKFIRVKADTD